ncbi:MAG: HTTM domain-containing protein [Gemmatimonadetes bacterium]|nr:HTTM domain-containing protein [Gemmatimonadota bacterium]MBA4158346.1 HTTM domain-containing protein [Gemmatimonadota bacterium]
MDSRLASALGRKPFLAAPGQHGADPDRAASRALTIFAALWAIATIFHQIAYPERHVDIFQYALTLAALWLLLRPSSLLRLGALVVAQLVQVAYYTPNFVSNHWLFTAFVNITILLAFAHLFLTSLRGGVAGVDRAELFRTFAPAVRIEVLILYFFATLHKLNSDFLNPETSCAIAHYTDLATARQVLPTGSWVHPLAIYGTLAIEGAIPLLLLFRRTRVPGILLGAGFHFLLAFTPGHRFFDFSSMIFAVYFLFLPFDFIEAARRLATHSAPGRWLVAQADSGFLQRVFQATVLAIGAVLLFGFATGFDPGSRGFHGVMSVVSVSLWALYGATVIAVFLVVSGVWNVSAAVRGIDTLKLRRWSTAIVPLLVFFNGLNPYLGLKTESSFAMFSNLRTEGGATNHLFMPNFRLAGYQDDLVEIVASSDRYFQGLADNGFLIPHFEFRRMAVPRRDASVSFIRGGERYDIPRIGDDPELARHAPFLQRAVLTFRPVHRSDQGIVCSH